MTTTTPTTVPCHVCDGTGSRREQTFTVVPGKRLQVGWATVPCRVCHGAGSLDERLAAAHKAASDLSYYNAAEGSDYRNEAGGRGRAREELRAAIEVLQAAGMYDPADFSTYLI